MANQYFINRTLPAVGETFVIENADTAHHIFTVMRAKAGDTIQLVFQTDKTAALAEVISEEAHTVKLLELLNRETELPVEVTILLGFPKGDKLDFITEKATELGAAAIWAAPFAWSVVKWNAEKLLKKQEKLAKIAQKAAEQSQRLIIPDVQLFDSLSEGLKRFSDFDQILIAYEEAAKTGEQTNFAHTLAQNPKRLLLIFGPEGGISPEEISRFTQAGASSIGLGSRILRAETAPLAALAAISAYYELFRQV